MECRHILRGLLSAIPLIYLVTVLSYLSHHASCTDSGPFAYGDSWQDDDIAADPTVFADMDLFA